MRVTKAFLALLAAQTALIVFLTAQLSSLNARVGDLAAESAAASNAAQKDKAGAENAAAAQRSFAALTTGSGAASRDDVRAIVHEEIEALAKRIAAQQSQTRADADHSSPVANSRETAALNAAVSRELSNFISSGRASPAEMAALQQKIARLPPSDREKALNQLTKAINEGRLDARL